MICDQCETVAHCMKNGCVPKTTVQQDIPDLIAGALGVSRGTAYDMMREALAEQPAQQQEPTYSIEQLDKAYALGFSEGRKAAIQQPAQQEPVCDKDPQGCWSVRCQLGKQCKNTPAQRQPLTPEWIWTWLMDWCKRNGTSPANYDSLFRMVSDARAIEAKLKEKNT